MLLILVIGLIIGVIIIISKEKNNQEIINKDLNKKGYNKVTNLIIFKYIGGIKTISSSNNVQIKLLKEGICFSYKKEDVEETYNNIIKFENIEDVYLDTQQSIQERVSLGKLICFGVLAFGLKGKQIQNTKEFIVLEVSENNKNYNIILDCKNIQQGLDTILKLKNENN